MMRCNFWCPFCKALHDWGDIGNTEVFLRLSRDTSLSSRLLFETQNFSVIAGLGQIAEGYLLLLTKQHFHSFAHIPHDWNDELVEVDKLIKQLLRKHYKSPIVFEHGAMPHSERSTVATGGGSCVSHAHLHYMPIEIPEEIMLDSLKEQFQWKEIATYSDLSKFAKNLHEYFLVETPSHERIVFQANSSVPPQYLRRIMAIFYGKPDIWNWRMYPEITTLSITVNNLNGKFPIWLSHPDRADNK